MTDAPPVMLPEEDEIGGTSTEFLFGAVIDYEYSTGRHYRLTFDHDFNVTFAWINHPPLPAGAPEFVPPPLHYRAREIRPDLYLVHWLVKEFHIHVSLSIDVLESKIHVAAMMPPNSWEFWDTAHINSIAFDSKVEGS